MAKIGPFEKYTEQYENWFIKNRFVYQSELKAIKKQLPKKGQGIEIGVGTGQFSAPLKIKIGIEPSHQMGNIARQRGVKIMEAVAENLPLAKASFDFALIVTTICFLDNIKAALKEIHRILKKQGLLVIGFVDKNSPLGKLYQKRKTNSIFYKIAAFYSVDEVIYYLKQANFKKFNFSQTIFNKVTGIKKIEPIKDGYGEGSFVVIKAIK